MFIVLATVITIVSYDRKTFIVQVPKLVHRIASQFDQ